MACSWWLCVAAAAALVTLLAAETAAYVPLNPQFEGVWVYQATTTLRICRRGGRLYGAYDSPLGVGVIAGTWNDDGTAEGEFFEGGGGSATAKCYYGRATLEQVDDFQGLLANFYCFETPDTPQPANFTRVSQERPLYYECAALAVINYNNDDDDSQLDGYWYSSTDARDTCFFDHGADPTTDEYFHSSFSNTSAYTYSGFAQGLVYRHGTITSGVYAYVGQSGQTNQLEALLEDGSYIQYRYDLTTGYRFSDRYRFINRAGDCDRFNTSTGVTFPSLNGAGSLQVAVVALVALVALLLF